MGIYLQFMTKNTPFSLKWYYDKKKNDISVIFTFRKYKHALLTVPNFKFKLQWEMRLF